MSTPTHPPSNTKKDIAIIVSLSGLFAIALALVSLRLHVRARILRALGWDDFFIVLALVRPTITRPDLPKKLTIVTSKVVGAVSYVIALTTLHVEATLHGDLLEILQDTPWLILNTVGEITVSTSLTFARISICLFLGRFFTTELKWKRTLHTIITLVIIAYMIWLSLYLTHCNPARKLFYPTTPGHCSSWTRLSAVNYYQGCKSTQLQDRAMNALTVTSNLGIRRLCTRFLADSLFGKGSIRENTG